MLIKTDTKPLFPKMPLDKLMATHHRILINEQTCNKQSPLSAVQKTDLLEG